MKKIRILTFDIEEWFHLLDTDSGRAVESWDSYEVRIHKNTERILKLLDDSKQKATFFCLGWVAEKFPEVIKSIDSQGYEIGSHSYYHQLAYELDKQRFNDDLKKSIYILEDITGKKVRSFRVPGFSITTSNTWALELLVENGIQYDSSIFPARRAHGGFESFGSDKPVILKTSSGNLKEFPINTVPIMGKDIVFSGGGYFRLLPYPIIHFFMKRSDYVMSYFHPRDFDTHQPIMSNLPINRKFKSYYGIKNAYTKLVNVLNEFNYSDISNAEKHIEWNKEITVPSTFKSIPKKEVV